MKFLAWVSIVLIVVSVIAIVVLAVFVHRCLNVEDKL